MLREGVSSLKNGPMEERQRKLSQALLSRLGIKPRQLSQPESTSQKKGSTGQRSKVEARLRTKETKWGRKTQRGLTKETKRNDVNNSERTD